MSAGKTETDSLNLKILRKNRWSLLGFVGAILLMVAPVLGHRSWAQSIPIGELLAKQENPLSPPGVSFKSNSKPVIGNLGGLPVTFPAGFVTNVEYDGDPGFGEKRIGPMGERTHQSGLRSLGFEVRYPEFAVTVSQARDLDKRKYSINNTPWLKVHLTSNSDFGDGLFLERTFLHMNKDKEFQFEKLPARQFELDAYTPSAVDVSKRNLDTKTRAYRSDIRDRDFFVHYGENGKIDAIIRCSNRNHDAAPCDHHFFLDAGVRTKITVIYRRGQLMHWKDIQSSIKQLLFSFKAS